MAPLNFYPFKLLFTLLWFYLKETPMLDEMGPTTSNLMQYIRQLESADEIAHFFP